MLSAEQCATLQRLVNVELVYRESELVCLKRQLMRSNIQKEREIIQQALTATEHYIFELKAINMELTCR